MLLFLAWSGSAHCADVKLKVGAFPIIDAAQFYAAIDQGYFQKAGIDIEVVTASGGAALVPALTAGSIQISLNNMVSILQAVEQGIKLRIVAPGTAMPASPPDITPLVVAKDGPVHAAKDLEGRTVAVNNLNNIVWLYVRAYLDKNGVDLAKVRFVEVPFPQMQAALLSGRVDAVAITEPFTTMAKESAKTVVLGYPYTQVQPNLQSAVFTAMDGWVENNRPVLDRFIGAYRQGIDFINSNRGNESVVRIISGYTKMDPAVVAKIMFPIFAGRSMPPA
jgi:NitT/TauT family transport system substrate-binding protein